MKKKTGTKRQHFVPRHYLMAFRWGDTEQVLAVRIDPYLKIGPASIDRQCKADYFYGDDGEMEGILAEAEGNLAGVINDILRGEASLTAKVVEALKYLICLLYIRTKKASEANKLIPKMVFRKVIEEGIRRNELPAPPGGVFTEEMIDFKGMPPFIIKYGLIPIWLESHTLDLKILLAPAQSFFITSDHPAAVLNQFCAEMKTSRTFAGFGRTGFQLALPISPTHCLFLFDSKTYKVGGKRMQFVPISKSDVEHCLYFHAECLYGAVYSQIRKFGHTRVKIADLQSSFPVGKGTNEVVWTKAPSCRLPSKWSFCKVLRKDPRAAGAMRDPGWSALIDLVTEDLLDNPNEDIFDKVARILRTRENDIATRIKLNT